MDDLFQKRISIYGGVKDNTGNVTTLGGFLSLAAQYKATIEAVRNEPDKDKRRGMKAALPCATIAGVFSPRRNTTMLAEPSNLICVDIDKADNPWFWDYPDLIDHIVELAQDPNNHQAQELFSSLLYADLSVSGNGIYCIHLLPPGSNYALSYKSLAVDYDRILDVVIDPQCKDVTRLRFISFGKPLVNEAAQEYHTVIHVAEPSSMPVYVSQSPMIHGEPDTIRDVYQLCSAIQMTHTDITSTYQDWLKAGMSLSSLGEAGREPFHIISSQYPKYSRKETDKKFDNLLKESHRVDISTFFYMCKQHNITFR